MFLPSRTKNPKFNDNKSHSSNAAVQFKESSRASIYTHIKGAPFQNLLMMPQARIHVHLFTYKSWFPLDKLTVIYFSHTLIHMYVWSQNVVIFVLLQKVVKKGGLLVLTSESPLYIPPCNFFLHIYKARNRTDDVGRKWK